MPLSIQSALTATNLLKLLTRRISRHKYLSHVVDELKELSGCGCVGVRLLHEEGTIPYEAYAGFSEEFRRAENNISIRNDQCACIRVITGAIEAQDASMMTGFGSFRCNDVREFVKTLTHVHLARYRSRCFHDGFRSVAIVPVRYRDEVIAAIHFGDGRAGMFTTGRIEAIESLTPVIGEAIHKFMVEDKLKQYHAIERIVNMLMRMSLEEASIREICGKALEKLFSMTWLSLDGKGCVFLVKDAPSLLVMEIQRGLDRETIKNCARVPFGSCFCGNAALSGAALTSVGFDHIPAADFRVAEHHDVLAIPMMASGKVLGVMMLMLREKQHVTERQREALMMVTNTLAGIIARIEMEEKLRESQGALRRLAVHLQKSTEEERTRIAREVHDELGQSLTALKMELHWLKKRLPRSTPELAEKADESLDLIDATINSVRRICTELRPAILDHLGLDAAVEWQVGEFRRRTGISCALAMPKDIVLHRDLALAAFRIVQEALTNIVRHAHATEMSLSMAVTQTDLTFVISDNGRGIPKRQVDEAPSLGLLGIRERVRFWNGEFAIESPASGGTIIRVSIPMLDN